MEKEEQENKFLATQLMQAAQEAYFCAGIDKETLGYASTVAARLSGEGLRPYTKEERDEIRDMISQIKRVVSLRSSSRFRF